MTFLSHQDHSLDIIAARRMAGARRRIKATAIAYPGQTWADLIELEFGTYGRDPRFPSGWYIAPVILTLLLLIPLAL
jgi:hypothetical protein